MKVGVDDLLASAGLGALDSLPRIPLTPPRLEDAALYGLAGRIVRAIEPQSEADPTAILLHLLVGVGNLIGPGPHARVEQGRHGCNEFAVLVGDSAVGRKGQAWSTPKALLGKVDPAWAKVRQQSGLSSGEGVIHNVRDPRSQKRPIKSGGKIVDYEDEIVDHGEDDKRLLVIEPEFATVLKRMKGETNSLSPILRHAWDDGNLSTMTKTNPDRATGAHISIVAHVTRDELLAVLTEVETVNGFANRFLFAQVRRSKVLPEPEPVHDDVLEAFAEELRSVVAFARGCDEIKRDEDARVMWNAVYPELTSARAGLVGSILARGAPHVLRLSVLYAVLDLSPRVRPEHLEAALAIWAFAETSAKLIFGSRLGFSTADIIFRALRTRGPMTRTEIFELFRKNKSAAQIDHALEALAAASKARMVAVSAADGRGRPAVVWEAI
jgi:hypothetical protein